MGIALFMVEASALIFLTYKWRPCKADHAAQPLISTPQITSIAANKKADKKLRLDTRIPRTKVLL